MGGWLPVTACLQTHAEPLQKNMESWLSWTDTWTPWNLLKNNNKTHKKNIVCFYSNTTHVNTEQKHTQTPRNSILRSIYHDPDLSSVARLLVRYFAMMYLGKGRIQRARNGCLKNVAHSTWIWARLAASTSGGECNIWIFAASILHCSSVFNTTDESKKRTPPNFKCNLLFGWLGFSFLVTTRPCCWACWWLLGNWWLFELKKTFSRSFSLAWPNKRST